MRDDLSGFVDETLPERRWEDVARHLAGCPLCRQETLELRELRSALSQSCRADVAAPANLAERLEAIAGEDSTQPLYLGQGHPHELPSRRRRRRRVAAQGSAALVVLALGVVVLAAALAPEPRIVADVVRDARQQFARQATAVNVQEAVGAVVLAQDGGARLASTSEARTRAVPAAPALPISRSSAAAMLGRGTGTDVAVRGMQEVFVSDGDGGFHRADVSVTRVAGEGANLVVFDEEGHRYLSSFAPDFTPSDVSAPSRWSFFTRATVDHLVGRDAVVLEARKGDVTVARWWLDVATGSTLRSERFDADGRPTIIVGYRSLRVGGVRLPEDRTPLVSLSRATTSGSRGWCVGMQECPFELAGLPLVAHASSTVRGARSMSLVYSDGVETISVAWNEGRLATGERASAAAAAGLPSVEAWQAGQGVVWVATDGPPALLDRAAQGLPEPEAHDVGLGARVGAGLARIAGLG